MKKFILITTRDGEAIIRNWVSADSIVQLSQNSITEASQNEGTCIFQDGSKISIIAFDQTINSLNQ